MTLREVFAQAGLEAFTAAFEAQHVTLEDLPHLTDEDLANDFGMQRYMDRKRLRAALAGGAAPASLDSGATRLGSVPPVSGGETRVGLSGPADLPPRIGSYIVLDWVGAGSQGVVARARHADEAWARRQGDVALKFIHPHLVAVPAVRERFVAEAHVGRRLSHPSLAAVYDVISDGPWLAMAMEYVDGAPFSAHIQPGGLPLDIALALLEPLADALDHLHAAGIVHRDVKPDNVRVRADGRPVLLDLGVARDGEGSGTRTGVPVGTRVWMAPEQAEGRRVDASVDRYALGLIAYALLVGRMPWPDGTSEVIADYLKVKGELVPLPRADVPAHVRDAITAMLAADPAARPTSANGWVRAMRRVSVPDPELHVRIAHLIHAHRAYGHCAADMRHLEGCAIARHPELDPAFYGLTDPDMDVVISTSPLHGLPPQATVRDILAWLRQVYYGNIGVEFMNILDADAKRWVQRKFETLVDAPPIGRDMQIRMLDMLTRAEGFERFLGLKFQGYKRYSLEGGESLIPLLDRMIDAAGRQGVRECVIGMARRGRLNVLLNILHKPPAEMLAEFVDHTENSDENYAGDVKFQLGHTCDYTTMQGDTIRLTLAFNPDHLEAVNPVVEGRVRAKQDRTGDTEGATVMPLLIHGDAAFAGQGLNAEVLNLSGLPGYRTGGTVHVVVNNQVGHTTSPHDARSTPYATDIARMLGIPIFHVNGEDPETVARIVELAMEWRQTFKRDVVIDLHCFRKHGHNEQDEPAFTQPTMYRKIAQHPGVRELYVRSLESRGILTRAEADAMSEAFRKVLDDGLDRAANGHAKKDNDFGGLLAKHRSGKADVADTRVPMDTLQRLLLELNRVPDDFRLHPKLRRWIFEFREEQAAGTKPLDWAAGELLAYATLVSEGARVRLSGQDCKRGTFSHRHAVYFDAEDGREHCPLQHLRGGRYAGVGPFEVYNSLLSEAGVLGFEYGYSLDYPDALVLWEAQFGDFANGAQVIIDNFLVSGETKWKESSGLTLFLPHGYEGQGPDNSSARIERFLQMAAQNNIQCVNCTTPAQIFHVLRRQLRRAVRRPLVVFTPKSLLRAAQSSLADLANGAFQSVIGDGDGRSRVVLCSGKIYYDLVAARTQSGKVGEVAIVRVEELYPFPLSRIREEVARHPGAEIVWCQEEPKNMGPWPFFGFEFMEAGLRVHYAGRPVSASSATGNPGRHSREQREVVAAALAL